MLLTRSAKQIDFRADGSPQLEILNSTVIGFSLSYIVKE